MAYSVVTDLSVISVKCEEKEEENGHFLQFILRQNGVTLDQLVHNVNDHVAGLIDCTHCGNCCKMLMINVTAAEITQLASYLGEPVTKVKSDYIEESLAGNCIVNSIPCHFLHDKKCSIYPGRFRECRDFPHLHKEGFKERLSGTLMYYGSCPIVYNVIEIVKEQTGFLTV